MPVGDDLEAGDAGGVYVFTRTGLGWEQQAYPKAAQPESGAGFGQWVPHGRLLPATADAHGSVHLFSHLGGQWSQTQRLDVVHGGGDLFGSAPCRTLPTVRAAAAAAARQT